MAYHINHSVPYDDSSACGIVNAVRESFQRDLPFSEIKMNSVNANRAVVYANPGTTETEVVSLAIPEPGPGQILVKM